MALVICALVVVDLIPIMETQALLSFIGACRQQNNKSINELPPCGRLVITSTNAHFSSDPTSLGPRFLFLPTRLGAFPSFYPIFLWLSVCNL